MKFYAKHVGYGPSGTPAGMVYDRETGKAVSNLTSLRRAQEIAERMNADTHV